MAEYIERETLLTNICDDMCGLKYTGVCENCRVVALIADTPAADVAPVVHATWVLTSDFGPSEFYHCSRCGREEVRFGKSSIYQQYPYCHCGAKMDGGDNDAST